MSNRPFYGAELKVDWAVKHVLSLETAITNFCEGSEYLISIEHDSSTGEEIVQVVMEEFIPPEIALITGDAIHNFHSALDHAWAELSGIECDNFPMYPTREMFEKAIKYTPKKNSIGRFAKLILDDIQPYRGGNGDALFALHRLDIQDKHQLLISHVQIARLHGLWVEDGDGKRFGTKERIIRANRPLRLLNKGSRDLHVIKEGQLATTIIFGKGAAMSGSLVVPALRKFEVAVKRVLVLLRGI